MQYYDILIDFENFLNNKNDKNKEIKGNVWLKLKKLGYLGTKKKKNSKWFAIIWKANNFSELEQLDEAEIKANSNKW